MELELTRNVYERNLTHKQIDAIREGQVQRERMELYISGITRNIPSNTYKDLYIYSKPGLGKTHSVKEYISNDNVKNVSISGDTSMFAFGIQLAVIGYIYRNEQKVIIHIDDCDKLFSTEETINIMKKVLDKGPEPGSVPRDTPRNWPSRHRSRTAHAPRPAGRTSHSPRG